MLDVMCDQSSHESLKQNLSRWATLRLCGVQQFTGSTRIAPYALELRDCDLCGSTLAMRLR